MLLRAELMPHRVTKLTPGDFERFSTLRSSFGSDFIVVPGDGYDRIGRLQR